MLSPEDIDAHGMKLNNFSLKISDRRLEKKYNFTRKKKALKFSRSYYLLLIVTFAIYVIFNLIIHEINVSSYLKITIVIIGFLILSFMFTDLYNSLYYKCVILAYIISIFIKILFDWLVLDNNLVLSCALLIVVSTCSMNLNINILYVIVLNAIYLLNFIVRVIVLVVNNDDMLFSQSIGTTKENRSESDSGLIKFNIAVSFILLMWMISSISVYLNYKLDHQKRNEFMIAMQIELESNKVKDIFSILVPKFVRANMINGNLEMSEEYNNVSIIFCDIYNFDQMIATENERVVQILDNIYRFYDLLCQTYGVQKIEVNKIKF